MQGVFFRAHTRERALSLGLTGVVRNLMDGRVEVIACGDEHRVGLLCQWLREGPPAARVDEVTCSPAEDAGFSGFGVG